MLNCNYCDYFTQNKGKKVCLFSDHLFIKNPIDMEKYPCQNMSYDDFLSKQEKKDDMEIVA